MNLTAIDRASMQESQKPEFSGYFGTIECGLRVTTEWTRVITRLL